MSNKKEKCALCNEEDGKYFGLLLTLVCKGDQDFKPHLSVCKQEEYYNESLIRKYRKYGTAENKGALQSHSNCEHDQEEEHKYDFNLSMHIIPNANEGGYGNAVDSTTTDMIIIQSFFDTAAAASTLKK